MPVYVGAQTEAVANEYNFLRNTTSLDDAVESARCVRHGEPVIPSYTRALSSLATDAYIVLGSFARST